MSKKGRNTKAEGYKNKAHGQKGYNHRERTPDSGGLQTRVQICHVVGESEIEFTKLGRVKFTLNGHGMHDRDTDILNQIDFT